MIYTGFVISPAEMVSWFRWINYIDPIAYAFESLMINEFDGRNFDCANIIPTGSSYAKNGGNHSRCVKLSLLVRNMQEDMSSQDLFLESAQNPGRQTHISGARPVKLY